MQPQKQENIKLNWGNEKTWRTMNSTIPIRAQNGRTLKPIEVKIRESQTGYRKEVTIYECETWPRVSFAFKNVQKRKKETQNDWKCLKNAFAKNRVT